MKNLEKPQIVHLLAIGELISTLGKSIEPFCSISQRSIPGAGSDTRKTSTINETSVFLSLDRIVKHKSGDITLCTSAGNIRLWRSTWDKEYETALQASKVIYKRLAYRQAYMPTAQVFK